MHFCHFRSQPVERTRFTLSHFLWLAVVKESINAVRRIGFTFSKNLVNENLSIITGEVNNTNLLGIWKDKLQNYYCHLANADIERAYY